MFYKAMFSLGGRYYSAMALHLSDDAIVEYKLNELAVSPLGPIMAFRTLQAAYDFKSSLGIHTARIVIASADGEEWNLNPESVLVLNKGRNYTGAEIKEFWNSPDMWTNNGRCDLRRIPDKHYFNTFAFGMIYKDSVLCSWIKPMEILSEEGLTGHPI